MVERVAGEPSPEEEQHCSLGIGQRLECLGSCGTLRYVGEVPPTQGTWLGVDWDDPNRGKHNGTFQGRFYFTTRYPRSGSFVRHAKVNLGCDCVSAIHSRYGEVRGDETAGVDRSTMASVKKEMKAALFEVVGFDKVNKKQSQFDRLEVVFLKGQLVNGPGPQGALGALCPRVRELDLSSNLLASWEAVADISCQLPKLWMLNVSENRLSLPKEPLALMDSFDSLKHVVAGRMEYTWSEVVTCCSMWPNLETLQVPFNCISTLDVSQGQPFRSLKVLDLEGNPVHDWRQVNQLGKLPSLESLNLCSAPLSEVKFPSEAAGGKTELFPALKHLILSHNRIRNWESLCELDKLQLLEDLRFQENPVLCEENFETSRQLIIARIERLQKLNGIEITRDERKGAEYDYLKRHAREWLDINKSENKSKPLAEFVAMHPRFPALVEKHGAPEEGEIKVLTAALRLQLINVEIFSPKAESKVHKKRLPLNMSVQKLVGLVQRLYNTGSEVPNLTYISSKHPDIEAPLDNQMKEIGFYSVEDGDRIVVNWN